MAVTKRCGWFMLILMFICYSDVLTKTKVNLRKRTKGRHIHPHRYHSKCNVGEYRSRKDRKCLPCTDPEYTNLIPNNRKSCKNHIKSTTPTKNTKNIPITDPSVSATTAQKFSDETSSASNAGFTTKFIPIQNTEWIHTVGKLIESTSHEEILTKSQDEKPEATQNAVETDYMPAMSKLGFAILIMFATVFIAAIMSISVIGLY
uniref:uncharacterized protein LOC120340355 n=1 Tax=Styela clava TaxID=7725 RepID=UPI00193A1A1A|nr:uncharacterized protein LOC120340355 [Styela clava]